MALELRGACHVHLAFSIGAAIDLDAAQRRVHAQTGRPGLGPGPRAPRYFDFDPRPLEIVERDAPPIPLAAAGFSAAGTARIKLFDFGSASFELAIPLAHEARDLVRLASELYDDQALQAEARRRIEAVVALLADAIEGRQLSEEIEQYLVFSFPGEPDGPGPAAWLRDPLLRRAAAQLLRCEAGALAEEQITDALAPHAQYQPGDLALVDREAAILVGGGMDAERAVLAFANVELLEMRLLDKKLDRGLEEAYRLLRRPRRFGGSTEQLRRLAELRIDGIMQFESVDNALTLFGDQHLARVHDLAKDRYGLPQLAQGILRKLETLQHSYQMTAETRNMRALLWLEVVVVILIALEIRWLELARMVGRWLGG